MKLFRMMSKIHLWLGIFVGGQVMLWLLSGLVMVIVPIEEVRGEHLRTPEPRESIAWVGETLPLPEILSSAGTEVLSARTGTLAGEPVWRLETADGPLMMDARTGESLSPVPEALALSIAQARQSGLGEVISQEWLDTPPREAGLGVPAWRIDFEAGEDTPPTTFYINSQTGELRAVRTTMWRVFDFFWSLHIMDWSTRENFNSWWIKVTSIIALIFGITGVVLAVQRMQWKFWPSTRR